MHIGMQGSLTHVWVHKSSGRHCEPGPTNSCIKSPLPCFWQSAYRTYAHVDDTCSNLALQSATDRQNEPIGPYAPIWLILSMPDELASPSAFA